MSLITTQDPLYEGSFGRASLARREIDLPTIIAIMAFFILLSLCGFIAKNVFFPALAGQPQPDAPLEISPNGRSTGLVEVLSQELEDERKARMTLSKELEDRNQYLLDLEQRLLRDLLAAKNDYIELVATMNASLASLETRKLDRSTLNEELKALRKEMLDIKSDLYLESAAKASSAQVSRDKTKRDLRNVRKDVKALKEQVKKQDSPSKKLMGRGRQFDGSPAPSTDSSDDDTSPSDLSPEGPSQPPPNLDLETADGDDLLLPETGGSTATATASPESSAPVPGEADAHHHDDGAVDSGSSAPGPVLSEVARGKQRAVPQQDEEPPMPHILVQQRKENARQAQVAADEELAREVQAKWDSEVQELPVEVAAPQEPAMHDEIGRVPERAPEREPEPEPERKPEPVPAPEPVPVPVPVPEPEPVPESSQAGEQVTVSKESAGPSGPSDVAKIDRTVETYEIDGVMTDIVAPPGFDWDEMDQIFPPHELQALQDLMALDPVANDSTLPIEDNSALVVDVSAAPDASTLSADDNSALSSYLSAAPVTAPTSTVAGRRILPARRPRATHPSAFLEQVAREQQNSAAPDAVTSAPVAAPPSTVAGRQILPARRPRQQRTNQHSLEEQNIVDHLQEESTIGNNTAAAPGRTPIFDPSLLQNGLQPRGQTPAQHGGINYAMPTSFAFGASQSNPAPMDTDMGGVLFSQPDPVRTDGLDPCQSQSDDHIIDAYFAGEGADASEMDTNDEAQQEERAPAQEEDQDTSSDDEEERPLTKEDWDFKQQAIDFFEKGKPMGRRA